MRSAIETRFLPATATKGARISARCGDARAEIAYPYQARTELEAHRLAAIHLQMTNSDPLTDQYAYEFLGAPTRAGWAFLMVGPDRLPL